MPSETFQSRKTEANVLRFLDTAWGRHLARILIVATLLLLWEYGSNRWFSAFLVSSPSRIGAVLGTWIVSGSLWPHVAATLMAAGFGYAIGASVGIAAGFIFGFFPIAFEVLRPYLIGLYSLPKIAFAPLFVLTLGIGMESKVALVAITVVFILLYATLDGIRNVDRDAIQSLQLMKATRIEIARKLLLPATLSWIFTGLRIAVRYALTAAILGEIIGSNKGLGYLIEYSAGQYDAAGVFAVIFVLMVCSVVATEFLSRTEASQRAYQL